MIPGNAKAGLLKAKTSDAALTALAIDRTQGDLSRITNAVDAAQHALHTLAIAHAFGQVKASADSYFEKNKVDTKALEAAAKDAKWNSIGVNPTDSTFQRQAQAVHYLATVMGEGLKAAHGIYRHSEKHGEMENARYAMTALAGDTLLHSADVLRENNQAAAADALQRMAMEATRITESRGGLVHALKEGLDAQKDFFVDEIGAMKKRDWNAFGDKLNQRLAIALNGQRVEVAGMGFAGVGA